MTTTEGYVRVIAGAGSGGTKALTSRYAYLVEAMGIDVLSYLRIIVLGDDLSFLRVVNTPSRKLGKIFIQGLKQIAEQENMSLFKALESNSLNRQSAEEFKSLIKEFRNLKGKVLVSDLIKEIIDKTGLSKMYRADGDEERLENIKELQNSIITLENDDVEKLTLENYLQEIALYTDMDVDDRKNDRVKLMTIQEYDFIFKFEELKVVRDLF